MLGINYDVTINNGVRIYFHNEYFWIGHYDINSKSLFIPMDYRQRAIKYLETVGLKVKE